jgi:STE24 endopeptidase
MTPPASRAAARTGLVVAVVGAVALGVLAAVLVPWNPVPGGLPSPAAADGVFTAEQVAKAEEFSRWARVWGWSSLAVSVAVACWLGFSSVGKRLVERLPGPWWVRVVLGVGLLALIGRLATLPLGYLMYRHLRDYGLSTQSTVEWLVDVGKGVGVGVVGTSLVLLVLVGCARRWQRAWPAVAGGILAVVVLLASFVYPLLVEPVFNNFKPLPDGSLRTQILELADREGVDVDQVLVADASRRTTTLNAYVSGFGGTRRVVVYDNLVDDLPQDEALSVVAHELAHARHRDVLTGSLLGAAGAVFATGLLAVLLSALGDRRRVSPGDPAVVPLVLALVALGGLVASPVQNTVSRQIETRADVDALETTGDADAFVAMQRQLALRSFSDPSPPAWSQFWFGSHPTTLQRIAIARQVAGRDG